jgi:hypothetical protein
MFLYYFDALMSKIIFKNKKNIILIYFRVKNTLKNNHNHNHTRIEKKKLLASFKKSQKVECGVHYSHQD